MTETTIPGPIMPSREKVRSNVSAAAPPGASPMVSAYAAARLAAPDYLVLYRVGEFYEVLH